MSDFDFLKEFAKGLDRERPHEPADADWEKIAVSLDAQQRSKRRRGLLFAWGFPLAASMVFAVLGALLWQTRSRADRMQVEILRLQTELSTKSGVTWTDTTVQHISVIQLDTIYRTVVMQTRMAYLSQPDLQLKNLRQGTDSALQKITNRQFLVDGGQTTAGSFLNPNTRQETNALAQSTAINSKVDGQKITVPSASGATMPTDSLAGIRAEKIDLVQMADGKRAEEQHLTGDRAAQKNALSMLPLKDILPLRSNDRKWSPSAPDMAVIMPAPKPRRVPLIHRLRPHNVMVGLTSGILFPQTQDATPRNNYKLGLSGQVEFGNHFRLLAGAELGRTNFKVDDAALNNSNIPPPPASPTPNDVFDYVQVEQPFWDFSLGLRYAFAPNKSLRPFVSAAWIGEQTLEQTLKYEFKNQVTQEEIYTLVPRNDARFNTTGLELGLGMEWVFAKRISISLEGIYQRQYGTTVPLLAERWGLKAGVTYSF